MRPTIVDVAQRAGVSKALVSLALNRRPGVADATRDRILAAADDLGWRPSVQARALSTARAFSLGLVIARDPAVLAADPFFPSFISGIEIALADTAYSLTLAMVGSPERERSEYRRLAGERRVDGVILTDLRADDPRIRLMRELALPAVTLGQPDGRSSLPAVTIDDRPGVRATIEHLVELGHRRVAHVAGPPDLLHGVRRRDEVTRALADAGLEPLAVVETDFSPAAGGRATEWLLGARRIPTAIVYANDTMAIAGIGVAQARGLTVPGDLSITGFDDSELARHVHPRLTSVATDVLAWGESAARTLLAAIDGERPAGVRLDAARLVVRDSTAPPPPLVRGVPATRILPHPRRPTERTR